MRAATLTLCSLAAGALGCQGSGGAVSVRWRIVDLQSGVTYDPNNTKAPDGHSCCDTPDGQHGQCAVPVTWTIESVSIHLADAATGATVPVDLAPISCSLREETTPFVLPSGTFAISLGATNDIGDGMNLPAPVLLPPPAVRTIVKGEVVNLDIIEIGVDPPPLPP